MAEFIVARNADLHSRLPFVLAVPLPDEVLWLKAAERWPRARRVYCHRLDTGPMNDDLQIIERVPVQRCERRGNAIDLVLARRVHKRSQFVFTASGARTVILWQTPDAAMAARPGLRIPRGRAPMNAIFYVDTREQHCYSFERHHALIERRALSVGDYAAIVDEHLIGVVERKAVQDFATSIVAPALGLEMAELATVPHAAVAVEGTYSRLLRHAHVRAGLIPELVSRLQVRYPQVSINFLESRNIAEEWTYRFLRQVYASAESLPL